MKIAILGAGVGQLPIIFKAQKRGWETVVITPSLNYPGTKYADHIIIEDVANKKNIVKALANLQIDAVVTDQLDIGVETAAYVAKELSLKGIGTEIARKFKDKFHMLKCAQKLGIPVPAFALAHNKEEALENAHLIGYPVVIKPLKNEGSKGVYKINTEKDLELRYHETSSFSATSEILIEKYIERENEFCVEAYTHNYITKNIAIGKRDYFDLKDTFIPQATILTPASSAKTHTERKILTINKNLVTGFKLPFGITHAEYLEEKETHNIYLVEVAARGGGVGISADLVPACTNVDMVDYLLNDIANEPVIFSESNFSKAAAYFCFMLPAGVVTSIKNMDKIAKIPEVLKIVENVNEGDITSPPNNKYSRKGPILVAGDTPDDCYDVLKQIKSLLHIQINNQQEPSCIIWE